MLNEYQRRYENGNEESEKGEIELGNGGSAKHLLSGQDVVDADVGGRRSAADGECGGAAARVGEIAGVGPMDTAQIVVDRTIKSRNYSPRPAGMAIKWHGIVIHSAASMWEKGVLSWLCSPESEVSAHYVISRDGHIYELIDPQVGHIAWHCRGHNARCIGIECVNDEPSMITAAQSRSLRLLCQRLMQLFGIDLDRVEGHRWMERQHTECPSTLFGMNESRAEFEAWREANLGRDLPVTEVLPDRPM
jgi:N-acetyl-anhydromuramyl-L-alanine amidase AmpD